MRFSFWPGPTQPYREVETLAKHVEKTGWDGLWFADHFMPNEEDATGPWYEAWTTLSALAADVPRLRLGPKRSGRKPTWAEFGAPWVQMRGVHT
jgi:alkanesulfonate monooxygenase SsuD/methylene tetrahydromethanopterin reductase-like flavin-dependent oxidoreductase (luciferase family)